MKYIIEFEDEYSMNEGGMKYHQCKQVPYWSVGHGIIKNLTPYTEPDRKAIEDEVWEFVRICLVMDGSDFVDAFDSCSYINLLEYSYQEAKSKYEAWLKQKDEIHVGDEVTYTLCGDTVTFIVLGKKKNKYYGFNPNAPNYDDVGEYCDADMLKKTGRHFPEVAELLEKMRGENN